MLAILAAKSLANSSYGIIRSENSRTFIELRFTLRNSCNHNRVGLPICSGFELSVENHSQFGSLCSNTFHLFDGELHAFAYFKRNERRTDFCRNFIHKTLMFDV